MAIPSLADLLPASFRGVPFAVRRTSDGFGRRLADHQYPGRDTPWVEDLGRRGRRFRFTGYMIENSPAYGGGPIDLQRAAIIAAAETFGSGLLSHPTLGLLTVSCDACEVVSDESADNACELEFSFLESGQQQYPTLLVSTPDATVAACAAGALAVAGDVADALTLASQSSVSGPAAVGSATSAWSAQVQSSAQDATAVLGLASQLSGSYGRYSAGGNAGFTTGAIYTTANTIDNLIADAATERETVATAAAQLATDVVGLNASSTAANVADDAQSLIDALSGACADPSDAIRLLLNLQAYAPPTSGVAAVDQAVGDMFHRWAVVALAQISASYQPTSQTNAQAVLLEILAVIDAEILIAGNEWADATFQALRTIRRNVVADLTTRGAGLAPIRIFSLFGNFPDVVVAQMIYSDPTRAAQLTIQVNPIHPLFMPTQFAALAS